MHGFRLEDATGLKFCTRPLRASYPSTMQSASDPLNHPDAILASGGADADVPFWRWDSGAGSGVAKTYPQWQGFHPDDDSQRALV